MEYINPKEQCLEQRGNAMELAFEARDIVKDYKNNRVLDSVSMKIKRGDIYGFIGENGAGKTTMIRLLSGLAKPTSGEIYLFGKRGQELSLQRSKIGYIIDRPSLYLNMNATENIKIHMLQKGIINQSMEPILQLVNLDAKEKTKVKNFSLGMQQRLALAIALTGEPEFLVLDELVNGLDPMGIIEIRDLLKKLNEKGITILISSHNLDELQKIATCYGILHKGKLLKELSNEELCLVCEKTLFLQVDDILKTKDYFVNKLSLNKIELLANGGIKIFNVKDLTVGEIVTMLQNINVSVFQAELQNVSLESYYHELIKEKVQ